ncbi:MAG: NUDIX hydrolase [Clostridia bacterium]|nr:NUDIX hydrolase [Clostridia bacterium]
MDRVQQHSAGGVVFRRGERGLELLLILDGYGRWSLPKGHLEPGETTEEAALREIREETGIEGEIRGRLPSSRYVFRQNGKLVEKTVTYYLVEAKAGQVRPQLEEIRSARWFTPDEIQHLPQYDNNRPVVRRALTLLSRGQAG